MAPTHRTPIQKHINAYLYILVLDYAFICVYLVTTLYSTTVSKLTVSYFILNEWYSRDKMIFDSATNEIQSDFPFEFLYVQFELNFFPHRIEFIFYRCSFVVAKMRFIWGGNKQSNQPTKKKLDEWAKG